VTGELNPAFMAATPFIVAAYYRLYMGRPQATKETINALAAVVVVLFPVDVFIISGDVVVAVAHLTLLFHAIKGFDVKDPWDCLQVLFMSLLQLLVASELTLSPVFAAVFLAFMVIMTVSMSYSHLLKEGSEDVRPFVRPIAVITLITALMTVVFFFGIPRFNRGLWGKSHSRVIKTGFSKNIRLGEVGEVKLNPSVVMRVMLDEKPSHALYWRGITFEEYDKNAWHDKKGARFTISGSDGVFNVKDVPPGKRLKRQEILLAPLDTDVLFALRGAARVEMRGRYVAVDDSGALFVPYKSSSGFKYTVFSSDAPPDARRPLSGYLQLPAGMGRIAALASRLAAGPSIDGGNNPGIGRDNGRDNDGDRAGIIAKKIENYLRSNFTYSLSTDTVPAGVSAVEHFLFTARRGWCEHYATAMTLMLRSQGIPARVVSGFSGGRYNRFGGYLIVRKSDAHTWVEAVVDNKWETFDPTPLSLLAEDPEFFMYLDMVAMNWDKYVIGYGSFEQSLLMRRMAGIFDSHGWSGFGGAPRAAVAAAVAGAAGMAVVIFMLLKIRRKTTRLDKISRRYVQVRRRVLRGARNAHIWNESITAAETFALASGLNGGMDEERRRLVAEFFGLYGLIRFGGESAPAAMKRYEELYRIIRRGK
jgi:transglutaminase-like putative cysteine protease